MFNNTGASLGPYARDLSCGNPAILGPVAHNQVNNRRSDAYQGYLWQKDFPSLTSESRMQRCPISFTPS